MQLRRDSLHIDKLPTGCKELRIYPLRWRPASYPTIIALLMMTDFVSIQADRWPAATMFLLLGNDRFVVQPEIAASIR